jgi:hypothetical protein
MKYLYFPSGIIRGALANLGVPCEVTAEILSLPACNLIFLQSHNLFILGNFTIKIKGV